MDSDKKLYKITKLRSVDNPKDIDSDFGESAPFHIGYYTEEPIIGERFLLTYYSSEMGKRGISTSKVTKIINDKTFETLNSVYSYEPFNK